jgi:hypothetical protein
MSDPFISISSFIISNYEGRRLSILNGDDIASVNGSNKELDKKIVASAINIPSPQSHWSPSCLQDQKHDYLRQGSNIGSGSYMYDHCQQSQQQHSYHCDQDLLKPMQTSHQSAIAAMISFGTSEEGSSSKSSSECSSGYSSPSLESRALFDQQSNSAHRSHQYHKVHHHHNTHHHHASARYNEDNIDRSAKRFHCPFPHCSARFSNRGHVERHVRVHTGEKPFKCMFPECNKSFSRRKSFILRLSIMSCI